MTAEYPETGLHGAEASPVVTRFIRRLLISCIN